jgi:hypothetical protein
LANAKKKIANDSPEVQQKYKWQIMVIMIGGTIIDVSLLFQDTVRKV